jgi:hypothetical protein
MASGRSTESDDDDWGSPAPPSSSSSSTLRTVPPSRRATRTKKPPGSDGGGKGDIGSNNNNIDIPPTELEEVDESPAVAHVPGYSSLRSLFENRRSIVLRGIRDHDGKAVIIKLLNSDYPTAVQLWLFEQQFELTRSLSNLEGVVKVLPLFILLHFQLHAVFLSCA